MTFINQVFSFEVCQCLNLGWDDEVGTEPLHNERPHSPPSTSHIQEIVSSLNHILRILVLIKNFSNMGLSAS
jgi:hypothetical protein